jgi:hypothetical protein
MKTPSILAILLLVIFLAPGLGVCEGFLAGVAKVDITPPLEMKASLGGYGERMSQPATGVHDRLWAKALVMKTGDKKYALVTADALGFPPAVKPAVMEKIEQSGWKREEVMLLPSHSHASFDMTAINPDNTFGIPQLGIYQPELFSLVVERIAQAILEAGSKSAPVTFGVDSRTLEDWAANRREGQSEKDEVLTVARFDLKDGSPLALLIGWAAHPTFMGAEEMMFSGGWPGAMQRQVETLVDGDVVALYYNGAQGDQRPVARPDSGASAWEKAERYGTGLGKLAAELAGQVETRPVEVFDHNLQTVELPPRTWHPDFMQTGGSEYGMRPEIMEMLIQQMVPETSTVGAVRINDFMIVGIPGELASGLGKGLKQKVSELTGASQVTIGGLANEWISYILSPEEYTRGLYEASVSFYGPRLGPTIVQAAEEVAAPLK